MFYHFKNRGRNICFGRAWQTGGQSRNKVMGKCLYSHILLSFLWINMLHLSMVRHWWEFFFCSCSVSTCLWLANQHDLVTVTTQSRFVVMVQLYINMTSCLCHWLLVLHYFVDIALQPCGCFNKKWTNHSSCSFTWSFTYVLLSLYNLVVHSVFDQMWQRYCQSNYANKMTQ